jgi:hypothetical protein
MINSKRQQNFDDDIAEKLKSIKFEAAKISGFHELLRGYFDQGWAI